MDERFGNSWARADGSCHPAGLPVETQPPWSHVGTTAEVFPKGRLSAGRGWRGRHGRLRHEAELAHQGRCVEVQAPLGDLTVLDSEEFTELQVELLVGRGNRALGADEWPRVGAPPD